MYPDDFELVFSQFLEGKDYDKGTEALFELARSAFLAGWKAGRKLTLLPPAQEEPQEKN